VNLDLRPRYGGKSGLGPDLRSWYGSNSDDGPDLRSWDWCKSEVGPSELARVLSGAEEPPDASL
jgi:hypothetical protein